MKTSHKNFYEQIAYLLRDRVAVGGSLALYARQDPSLSSDYVPGDIDLVIESEDDMNLVHTFLTRDGYQVSLDLPQGYAFCVRRQYIKGNEKHDFFIVPAMMVLSNHIDGVRYTHSSIVWAARGFYLGVGSEKSFTQLRDAGYITTIVPSKFKLKWKIKKLIMDIKYLLR